MNIYIRLDDIKNDFDQKIDLYDNIRLLFPKKNTIMDGEFTKLLFSNNCVTMNGLYIYLPLTTDKSNRSNDVNHIRGITNKSNFRIIQDLKQLELKLLEYYERYRQNKFQFENSLTKQLNTGNIRVYQDKSRKYGGNEYVIKISGIWESHQKIGLTYKMLEL